MFTGIVTDLGQVLKVIPLNEGFKLRISTAYDVTDLNIGASISCNGICLTVVQKSQKDSLNWFEVEAWKETLDCTTLSQWTEGTLVNLERSLKLGDELGGHLVSGHVDGTALIISCKKQGDAYYMQFQVDPSLMPFISNKGSVTIDGVSLTVNAVQDCLFDVLIISHTLDVTNLGKKQKTDKVNIEVDRLARMVARLLETSPSLMNK